MRLAALLVVPALAALAWTAVGVVLGLPAAATVAGAALGAFGGLLATAVCGVGDRACEPPAIEARDEPPAAVVALADTRFGRSGERVRPGDRVA